MDDNDDNTTENPSAFLNLNRTGAGTEGGISPLEQDVLDEYARLSRNMKTVCHTFGTLLTRRVFLYRHLPPFCIIQECAFPNMSYLQLNTTLQTLSSGPITVEIAEGLRLLERKVASVYTLMKASVYSIVLQQGQVDEDCGQGEGSVDG